MRSSIDAAGRIRMLRSRSRRGYRLRKLIAMMLMGAVGIWLAACIYKRGQFAEPSRNPATEPTVPSLRQIRSDLTRLALQHQSMRRGPAHAERAATASPSALDRLEVLLAQPDFISPGRASDAIAYYERISVDLQLPIRLGVETTQISALLVHLGYGGLHAKDLEQLPSDVLMDPSRLQGAVRNPEQFADYFGSKPLRKGEILSTRFFAPKIVDMTLVKTGSVDNQFGWRKLIRLNARPCSVAEQRGISAAHVLFNFAETLKRDPGTGSIRDPFAGQTSKNNQVMLVRRAEGILQRAECPAPLPADPPQSAYWLVFGPVADDGSGDLLPGLTGVAFELPETQPPSNENDDRFYFVPTSCAVCHGGQRLPKLNLLDTNHWFDRIQPGDDFSALAENGMPPVLFDAGQNPAPERFAAAFETIVTLNREVQQQSADADRGENPSIQLRTVEKWLSLHGNAAGSVTSHQPPIARALQGANGVVWDPTQPREVELLGLLNRFCYRCHSSVGFSVFDKNQVLERVQLGTAEFMIANSFMPQDRTLASLADRGTEAKDQLLSLRRLQDLLKELETEPTQ